MKPDAYRGVHTRIVYAGLNGVVQREAARCALGTELGVQLGGQHLSHMVVMAAQIRVLILSREAQLLRIMAVGEGHGGGGGRLRGGAESEEVCSPASGTCRPLETPVPWPQPTPHSLPVAAKVSEVYIFCARRQSIPSLLQVRCALPVARPRVIPHPIGPSSHRLASPAATPDPWTRSPGCQTEQGAE